MGSQDEAATFGEILHIVLNHRTVCIGSGVGVVLHQGVAILVGSSFQALLHQTVAESSALIQIQRYILQGLCAIPVVNGLQEVSVVVDEQRQFYRQLIGVYGNGLCLEVDAG